MSFTVSPSRLVAVRRKANALLLEVDKLFVSESDVSIDFYEEVQCFEIGLVRWALEKTGGRQKQAARLLNLNPTTLNAIIKRYGLLKGKKAKSTLAHVELPPEKNISSIVFT